MFALHSPSFPFHFLFSFSWFDLFIANRYMPQQVYVPYEMTPEQMMMFEMQNQHNMQFQGMQNMQATMQVRGPNGQIMQVVHPASAYPMGMVPGQPMQTFPQQIPAQHMQGQGHAVHAGHAGTGAQPHGQVHVHPHGAPQQVYVPQEMYAQQPQMMPIPIHMTPHQQPQGGAAVPAHMQQGMQPGMMHLPVSMQVPPGGSYNNYPPAVTGMHMGNAQHYNPNLGPQYGPQGGNHMPHQHNSRPPHPNGPHDPQGPAPGYGPGQGQGSHQGGPGPRGAYQKSPLPPRDHHNNNSSGPPAHGPPAMASLPGPHHAHPASPSAARYNQSHAAPHAPHSHASGSGPAAGPPATPSAPSPAEAGSAAEATGVAAGSETTAVTAAPSAGEQEAQTSASGTATVGTEGSSAVTSATEGGVESTPVKVNHTVVYPYQEHDPSQNVSFYYTFLLLFLSASLRDS